MRKFLVLYCVLFLLMSCSSQRVSVKHIENKANDEVIATGLHFLYGGGYRLVKNDDGFAVETFRGINPDLEWNELYKNDDFVIYFESENNNDGFETGRTYYLEIDDQKIDILQFDFPGHGIEHNYELPHVYVLNERVYFTHVEDNNLIIQEIKNNKLINYESYLIDDQDYELEFLLKKENEKFLFYTSDETVRYVVDEGIYEFSKNDWVVILDDYFLYSSYIDNQLQGSYLLSRNDGNIRQLNKEINALKLDQCTNPMHVKGNQFLFEEIIDGKIFYAHAEVEDNVIQIVRLPLEHNGDESSNGRYSFFSDKEIIISPINPEEGTFSYHVITIK